MLRSGLIIDIVENGFVVSEKNHDTEKIWIFDNAEKLGLFIGDWGASVELDRLQDSQAE